MVCLLWVTHRGRCSEMIECSMVCRSSLGWLFSLMCILLLPDRRTCVLLQQVDRWQVTQPEENVGFREKETIYIYIWMIIYHIHIYLQVLGRSLAAESDFIIKGIKNIFLRWLTLCSAVISGLTGRLPRHTEMLHNVASQVSIYLHWGAGCFCLQDTVGE